MCESVCTCLHCVSVCECHEFRKIHATLPLAIRGTPPFSLMRTFPLKVEKFSSCPEGQRAPLAARCASLPGSPWDAQRPGPPPGGGERRRLAVYNEEARLKPKEMGLFPSLRSFRGAFYLML